MLCCFVRSASVFPLVVSICLQSFSEKNISQNVPDNLPFNHVEYIDNRQVTLVLHDDGIASMCGRNIMAMD